MGIRIIYEEEISKTLHKFVFFLISRTKFFLWGGNVIPSTNKISKYDYHNICIQIILTKYVEIEA